MAGEEDPPTADGALQSDIRSDAGNEPFPTPAGMRFPHCDDVADFYIFHYA